MNVDVSFSQRDDGQVDVDLGVGWERFTDALNDCVSSLPPRGATGNGPSTHWIDVAADGLDGALASRSDRPFIWGNTTLLRVVGDRVEARYEFAEDDEEGQFLDVTNFRRLLALWRTRIELSAATSSRPLPETYRRNP